MTRGLKIFASYIGQAKAVSSCIKGILKDFTGKEIDTFPVMLFPGWFVEADGNRQVKMGLGA